MRRWKTPTGAVLAEVRDGFALFEGGVLRREFKDHDSSVQEWLYRQRYRLEGDALLSDFTGESDGGSTHAQHEVVLSGLVELPAVVGVDGGGSDQPERERSS